MLGAILSLGITLLFMGIIFGFFLLLIGPNIFATERRVAPEDVTIWYRLKVRFGDYERADCGCVYRDYLHSWKPDTELVTGDLAERKTFWKQSESGAKKEYKLYEEKLHRCTNCGNFVFEEELKEGPIKIWPEEPLPDEVAETNHEIRET